MIASPVWTLEVIASRVGGVVHGDRSVVVSGVSTDSRATAEGSLFVAVRGETFDGHDFASSALEAGAAAVLVTAGSGVTAEPRIEVDDTIRALRDLAALRRSEISVPVVAVTGSTGKTSTKDILRSVLPGAWASPASFNNEVGLPLTILSTPRDAGFVVAEVGSRGRGHISWLAPAVRPDVAIITNLGVVHMETFGTPEVLAAAKWELVESLVPGGTAVLPHGESRFPEFGRVVTFGATREANVSYSHVELDPTARPRFTLWIDDEAHRVRMAMAGVHQAANAAAAAAAARIVGVPVETIIDGLARAEPSPGRMEIHHGPVTVVNDAYNANPDSVSAGLRSVAELPGRHVAVLGLMAELGPERDSEHVRVGSLARELGYAAVVVVGADHGIAAGAGPIARPVRDEEEALAVLGGYLRDGDVVLVKASNVVGLQRLAKRLAGETDS